MNTENQTLHPETLALHHAHDPLTNAAHSIAVPLYQNTAYAFGSSETARKLFELREDGYIYSRLNNPTTDVLEQRIAAYEKGIGGVATSCGQSAVATALLTLLQAGDHVAASGSLYGGTFNLLNSTLPRFGIRTTFCDFTDVASIEQAITPETKLLYCEVLGNPKLDFINIPEVAAIAHRHGLPLFVDGTLTTGLYHPLADGADVLIHSLTKYVCGNGTTMGGIIVDAGTYDWGNGRFPLLSEPNSGYGGQRFCEAFGAAAYLVACRTIGLRDFGSCLYPGAALALIHGLETLEVRMERISKNALELAQWLEGHPEVAWVRYTGLERDPFHHLASEKLGKKHGGILTFGPKGGYEQARRVSEGTHLFQLVANFGDTKSLIIHPASTTHGQLSAEEQECAGVSVELIRLAIGLENVEDLKADLDQALRHE